MLTFGGRDQHWQRRGSVIRYILFHVSNSILEIFKVTKCSSLSEPCSVEEAGCACPNPTALSRSIARVTSKIHERNSVFPSISLWLTFFFFSPTAPHLLCEVFCILCHSRCIEKHEEQDQERKILNPKASSWESPQRYDKKYGGHSWEDGGSGG